mmetsp:Transcript_90083/g.280418  ORF Transcript_90083/g.280418 Transcript_90083/m.280418 type:complete len:202 (+) Transcript_90083:391-996(+)
MCGVVDGLATLAAPLLDGGLLARPDLEGVHARMLQPDIPAEVRDHVGKVEYTPAPEAAVLAAGVRQRPCCGAGAAEGVEHVYGRRRDAGVLNLVPNPLVPTEGENLTQGTAEGIGGQDPVTLANGVGASENVYHSGPVGERGVATQLPHKGGVHVPAADLLNNRRPDHQPRSFREPQPVGVNAREAQRATAVILVLVEDGG